MDTRAWRAHVTPTLDELTPAPTPGGKSSVTSRMGGGVVLRVADPETAWALGEALRGSRVHRAAERDANGVAADADVAVARAASGSGSALPTHLQRQFEGSTGADLSGVRVHTGADSAAAARAVGAKAYTVGQDIHFAEGRYQPDDPFGMHLLAHEVAHTVQQQGGTAQRQHKLEVSTPHDAAEVEADRAADAMVRGEPVAIAGAAVQPMRSPDAEVRKRLPRPVYWNNSSGGEVTGTWTGAPTYSAEIKQVVVPLSDPNAGQWSDIPEQADALGRTSFGVFLTDWMNAQGQWNNAAPKMETYASASADAEQKGLIDLDPSASTDVDSQLDGGTLPGTDTPTGNAFDEDSGQVLGAGSVDMKKLSREERLAIDKAKKECEGKTGAVQTAAVNARNQQRSVQDAALGVDNAKAELASLREEAKKKNLEGHVDALEKSCSLVSTAIGAAFSAVGGEGKAGKALAGAEGVADIINTLVWDSKISQVKGEIAVIDGSIGQLSQIQKLNGITTAKNNLLNQIGLLQNAHRDYDEAMRNRATAYQDLSTLMEAAATKGGANKARAHTVGVAVQAIPAMEYVVETCKAVADALTPLNCSETSALGCAMSMPADQATMRANAGAISATKTKMTELSGKWSKRLASTRAMINGAR